MKWAERLHTKISETQGLGLPTKPTKPTFVSSVATGSRVSEEICDKISVRHAYRFRLYNGDGGTLITCAATVDTARDELETRYGARLAVVVKA